MEKIKKYRFEILIFMIEAVCMIIELVASRILSPRFGSSNVVWTSVIAVILLSSSIGNYLGGKIADKENAKRSLCITLILSAILIFATAIFADDVALTISKTISSIKLGAIMATMLIFLIPSIFLGIIPPIVLKLKLESLDNAGRTAGRITAISTIGAIFGTILGGFWLVPNIGSVQMLYFLALITILLAYLVGEKMTIKMNIVIISFVVISVSLLGLTFYINSSQEEKVIRGDVGPQISFDTEYSRILVYNTMAQDEKVRIFNTDSGYETIAYVDANKKHVPYSQYIKKYDLIFNSKNEIKNIMMIGGAGYSYPRYLINTYKDKTIDVVEIDPKVVEIARKYFYLDDLLSDKSLNAKERLELIVDDGRIYLNKCEKKYDAILNDAFTGNTPPKSLTTIEAAQAIKNALNPNGIYATNIIGSLKGKNTKFLKAEVNTLRQVFKHVYVYPCLFEDEIALVEGMVRNNLVFATDAELELEDIFELELSTDEIILTDDYCPVDTLVDYD